MRRNRSGLPKHCSSAVDRHGKRRVRFRLRGFSTYLAGTPWSEDFMRQYAAALDGTKAESVGAGRARPGSVDAVIASYRRAIFPRLAPSTRTTRGYLLERFGRDYGTLPVNRLERENVETIFAAMADTPASANNLLKTLRHLLEHAITLEMIGRNPAAGIKPFKIKGDGYHVWSEDEVAQFETHHSLGTLPYLALHLLLGTGQRRSDVIKMGWQHVRGDKIAVRQEKTKTPLLLPIVPALAEALARVPRTNLTFLLASNGAPFTGNNFGKRFREWCDDAGLPQCTAHGLRKLTATRLANAGCSEREIMAITGHRSPAEVSRYTKARNQAGLAEQAMERLRQHDAENKTAQKIVQPAVPVGQSAS